MVLDKDLMKKIRVAGSYEAALALFEAETGKSFSEADQEVLKEAYEQLMSSPEDGFMWHGFRCESFWCLDLPGCGN